jgi:hypothetical protein
MSHVRWLGSPKRVAASPSLRWLGLPADVIHLPGNIQTLTDTAFAAYIDLARKTSYKLVSNDGTTRVYALAPLGTESGESFHTLLERLPVGTDISVSVDAPTTLPAATNPATTALFAVGPADNTGAWANFMPPIELLADQTVNQVTQASFTYDDKYGWAWECNPGYVWEDPINNTTNPPPSGYRNYTCVRKPGTASSGGGSDGTGMLMLLAVGAVALVAVAMGGKS